MQVPASLVKLRVRQPNGKVRKLNATELSLAIYIYDHAVITHDVPFCSQPRSKVAANLGCSEQKIKTASSIIERAGFWRRQRIAERLWRWEIVVKPGRGPSQWSAEPLTVDALPPSDGTGSGTPAAGSDGTGSGTSAPSDGTRSDRATVPDRISDGTGSGTVRTVDLEQEDLEQGFPAVVEELVNSKIDHGWPCCADHETPGHHCLAGPDRDPEADAALLASEPPWEDFDGQLSQEPPPDDDPPASPVLDEVGSVLDALDAQRSALGWPKIAWGPADRDVVSKALARLADAPEVLGGTPAAIFLSAAFQAHAVGQAVWGAKSNNPSLADGNASNPTSLVADHAWPKLIAAGHRRIATQGIEHACKPETMQKREKRRGPSPWKPSGRG